MKKPLTLALAFMAILLSSCGPTDSTGGGGTGEVIEATDDMPVFDRFNGELETNVKIQVLENDTAKSLGYLDELLDAFNAEYAEYGIEAVDANIDQYSDLAQDGPYGYGPDVLYQANDIIMKYVEGKHVMPLPTGKLQAYEHLPEAAIGAYKGVVGNVRYSFGVPVNVQAPMLFYRKDMLPENADADGNGIPDMVESWNALHQYSKEINAKDPTKRGYMKALYDVYFSSGYLFSYGGYVFGDGGTDPTDIGFNKGEAWKGAQIIRQQASAMGQTCVDDSINTTCYGQLARGEIFATMTTPDVTNNFITEMTAVYMEEDKLSEADAKKKAQENLAVANLPLLPKSGDLEEEDPELFEMTAMGGINGYAISSYTKIPNAALAFVNFATSYTMIKLREEILGVAPCRSDVVEASESDLSTQLFSRLENGKVSLMPSISETAQIWTPGETLNKDLASDPFRPEAEQKYKTQADFQAGLDRAVQQIEEAITTLA